MTKETRSSAKAIINDEFNKCNFVGFVDAMLAQIFCNALNTLSNQNELDSELKKDVLLTHCVIRKNILEHSVNEFSKENDRDVFEASKEKCLNEYNDIKEKFEQECSKFTEQYNNALNNFCNQYTNTLSNVCNQFANTLSDFCSKLLD